MWKTIKSRRRLTAGVATASLLLGAGILTPALAHDGDSHQGHARGSKQLATKLNGAKVPGGGDPNARGWAKFILRPKKEVVCFRIRWSRVDGVVTAAHIHDAPRGQTGPHHIDLLNEENLFGKWNRLAGCVKVPEGSHGGGHGHGLPTTQNASRKIRALMRHPHGYYLNIHSSGYPDGAIRGQLHHARRSNR